MEQKDTVFAPCCEENIVHTECVNEITSRMPNINTLYDLADLYRIFGDSTRIRILYTLFECELCVCDIAEILKMTVSAISHQLRILKTAGLVTYRRDGKSCYYSLADDHVKTIIKTGIEHITEGL